MDEDDISDDAKAEIARIRADQKANLLKAVSPADAAKMTGRSISTIERLVKRGELVSFLDGSRTIRLVVKSNPKKGPKPKRNPFFGVRPDWKKRKAEAEKRAGGAV
jgi:hypothetical protein